MKRKTEKLSAEKLQKKLDKLVEEKKKVDKMYETKIHDLCEKIEAMKKKKFFAALKNFEDKIVIYDFIKDNGDEEHIYGKIDFDATTPRRLVFKPFTIVVRYNSEEKKTNEYFINDHQYYTNFFNEELLLDLVKDGFVKTIYGIIHLRESDRSERDEYLYYKSNHTKSLLTKTI